MADKKEKKTQSIDDVFDEMAKGNADSIKKAMKARDDYIKPENQNKLFNDLFFPAQRALYDTSISGLDNEFESEKGDETKLSKKHEDKVKKAMAKGLRAYFKKVQPSIFKSAEGMNDEDAYQHLVNQYDEHIGNGEVEGSTKLGDLINQMIRGEAKVGDLKFKLAGIDKNNALAAGQILTGKYVSHHIGPHQHRLHAYIKKDLEKKGFQLKDDRKTMFYRSGPDQLIKLKDTYSKKETHPFIEEAKEK
jgi:hypothetical protein